MNAAAIARLRAQCDGPRDGALLRFALATALLDAGCSSEAVIELERAVLADPQYSAAWKALGLARTACADAPGAIAAFERGVAVAGARGDIQAAREMGVLLRRLQRV